MHALAPMRYTMQAARSTAAPIKGTGVRRSPTISSSTQGSESLLTARGGGLAIFIYCKRYSDNAGPGGAPADVPVGGPSDLLRREGRVWAPPRSSDCNMNRKAIPSFRDLLQASAHTDPMFPSYTQVISSLFLFTDIRISSFIWEL
jgi:hypothetical protein